VAEWPCCHDPLRFSPASLRFVPPPQNTLPKSFLPSICREAMGPILRKIYQVLDKRKNPNVAILDLLVVPLTIRTGPKRSNRLYVPAVKDFVINGYRIHIYGFPKERLPSPLPPTRPSKRSCVVPMTTSSTIAQRLYGHYASETCLRRPKTSITGPSR
jgi:hypothetical protein